MSVFTYNQANIKAWSTNIMNYLNGGDSSFETCSRKFTEQIDNLAKPNVWTGAAAQANFNDFLETQKAFKAFADSFGSGYQQAMNALRSNVANLEQSNLGTTASITDSIGDISYTSLSDLSASVITTDHVTYDYNEIVSISNNLSNIKGILDEIYSKLQSEISRIGEGSDIWGGSGAETSKQNLLDVLSKNMEVVNANLERCISNIKTAADNAQQLDINSGIS